MLDTHVARVARDPYQDGLSQYEAGYVLTAYGGLVESMGPMEQWQGSELRVLAGRICHQLGAPRKGRAYHFFTHRRDSSQPEAAYFYLQNCLRDSSILLRKARQLLEQKLPAKTRALTLALEARALCAFRDHTQAQRKLDEAHAIVPEDPWLIVCQANLLHQADKLDQALERTAHALSLQPCYPSAVREHASLLVSLGRPEEAASLLAHASPKLEIGALFWQLGDLESQLGRHADAERSLERAWQLLPLLEAQGRQALLAARADAAYLGGEFKAAQGFAAQVGTDFYTRFAEKLARGATFEGRKRLEVPWVRQKHMTCAPATLASIAQTFALPVDHDALSEEICYGGTQNHGERTWAERSGLHVQEFTVTLEVVKALVDRGVPFALTTVEPTSAHLQAVHGYDPTRESLLIRDPSRPFDAEYQAEAFFERYAWCGPRGLLFLPPHEASRLSGLVLPDSERYALLSDFQTSLATFQVDRAVVVLERLRALGADHRITLEAELQLAYQQFDLERALVILDKLLSLYPNAMAWVCRKAGAMESLASLSEQEALLDQHALSPSAHSAVVRAKANVVAKDVRRRDEARFWLRKAVRIAPQDALNTFALAAHCWADAPSEALEYYRFAACSEDTNEHYAFRYFAASRMLGKTEGLAFLEQRVERYAAQSSRPLETLIHAYQELHREDEAFALLSRALETHRKGPLLLFASETFARRGQFDRAASLLEEAKPSVAKVAWLSAAARIAAFNGEPQRVRELYQQAAELDPFNVEMHERYAEALAQNGAVETAVDYFRALCERYPHHYGMAQSRLAWAKRSSDALTEQALVGLLKIAPRDPWAQREYALWLSDQKRLDEALKVLEEQVGLIPSSPSAWGILGVVHTKRRDKEKAKHALRRALELAPDYAFALSSLMDVASAAGERSEELEYLAGLLKHRVADGAALLDFASYARGVLAPERLLSIFDEALRARPDLPAAHLALAREYIAQSSLEDAARVLALACETFPYRSALWLERAALCALLKDKEGRFAALERAYAVAPEDIEAAFALADELFARQQYEALRKLCLAALVHCPLSGRLRLLLAKANYGLDEKESAFSQLEHLCTVEPGYERAWEVLEHWAEQLGRPEAALAAARKLTEKRPEDFSSWLVLARIVGNDSDLTAFADAIARAAKIAPEATDIYDLAAAIYAQHGRWADALEACDPPVLRHARPYLLRGRRAWVLAAQGRLRDAIAELSSLIEEVPHYQTGVRWLCDFYERANEPEAHAATARKLVALVPDSSATHGYLAAALLDVKDRDGAKEQLWRALALNPAYTWAARVCFDLHFEDQEFDKAWDALAILEQSAQDAPETWLCSLRLRVHEGRPEAIQDAFQRLVRTEGVSVQQIENADEVARTNGFDVRSTLFSALQDEETKISAGEAWAALSLREDPFPVLKKALRANLSKAGVEGAASLIERLSETDARNYRTRIFFWRNREQLSVHTRIWGAVGFVLIGLGAYRACRKWLRDYEGREGLMPWLLINLAAALRENSDFEGAAKVHLDALQLSADHTTPRHHNWAAFYAALAGNLPEAQRHLFAGEQLDTPSEEPLARGCAEILSAAGTLSAHKEYKAILPLRFRLATLLRRTQTDLDRNATGARLVACVVRAIAASRPFLQRLWIKFAWRRP